MRPLHLRVSIKIVSIPILVDDLPQDRFIKMYHTAQQIRRYKQKVMTNLNTPKLILTAGLPGAGKSTYLRRAGISLPTVDPDRVKESHPDYDPKNPAELHEWSKKVARQQHLRLLSDNVSFVVDGTGTNVDKYARYINEARDLGYHIELHYVRVSTQTSIERNSKRDRNVPVSVIIEKAGVIDQTTKVIGKMCDEFIIVEND